MSRPDQPRQDVSSRREVTKDLESLKTHLGMESADILEGEPVAEETWRRVNAVDEEGTTLLMEASLGGAVDCVAFLLGCGVDVNVQDLSKRRAIDHAMGSKRGDRSEVVLLLLQRDSLLPQNTADFHKLILGNERLEQWFAKRDHFHKMAEEGDLKSIEVILENSGIPHVGAKYWANREGTSALYAAGKVRAYDVWALLKSYDFEYKAEEVELMETAHIKCVTKFIKAMEKYHTAPCTPHVHKMIARSRVLGSPGGIEKTIEGIYKEIDESPTTSLLLQCLQDEPRFQVVFDFQKSDVRRLCNNMACASGLYHPCTDRVYAAAEVSEEFDRSTMVSNLVHELTHKVMDLVFENGCLPYKKGDVERKKEYEKIVSRITSPDSLVKWDDIIERVKDYPEEKHGSELIVRVPEIISKYHEKKDERKGVAILKSQAEDLLNYYENHVKTEMDKYIKSPKMATLLSKNDFLDSLRYDYDRDCIEVECTEEPPRIEYKSLSVMRVSSLKLGVSHLEKHCKSLLSVDWRMSKKCVSSLKTMLETGLFSHVAIVWVGELESEFHRNCDEDNEMNLVDGLGSQSVRVTLVIPKTFDVPKNVEPVDYAWKDLSPKTKEWVLERRVSFQGKEVSLNELMERAVGGGEAEGFMDQWLSEDDLATLIGEEQQLKFGNTLQGALQESSVIPRRLRTGPVALTKEYFDGRTNDAFFTSLAVMSDLEGHALGPVCEWERWPAPEGCRCFLLEWDRINEDFEGILEKVKGVPCPAVGGWQIAHLFRHNGRKEFTYTCSLEVHAARSVIIADIPGSGKSVMVNAEALEMKRKFPERWVEVLQLTNLEEEFKKWKEDGCNFEEGLADFLFGLITGEGKGVRDGKVTLGQRVFNRFCESKECLMVFFDGFDEICPTYKETVMKFLEKLLQSTEVIFHVTTRVHESADLEKRLSTIAFNLVPLNRGEQVRLIATEWKSTLAGLEKANKRKTKIEKLIRGLMENDDLNGMRYITGIIDGLKQLAEGNTDSTVQEIEFEPLAEYVLNVGKYADADGDDLAGTPLHCKMVASVAFDDNFTFHIFKFQLRLYQRFIEIKVDQYSEDKTRTTESVASQTSVRLLKDSAYDKLKKFSADFFLEHKECNLEEEEKRDMLRVGLLAVRGNKTAFVHRTFGEYFLSLWLLEHAKKKKVTAEWISRVLRAPEFEKVRDFIEFALTQDTAVQGGGNELKKTALNLKPKTLPLPPGEQLVPSLQVCAFTCVLECREGILEYLLESAKVVEHLPPRILFESVDVDLGNVAFRLRREEKCWNAFSFCGALIKSDLVKATAPRSEAAYLKFLNNLLHLVKKNDLIAELKTFISEEGLWWSCIDYFVYQSRRRGAKTQIKRFFSFVDENKDVCGETLREVFLGTGGENLLVNTAMKHWDMFLFILESVFSCENYLDLSLRDVDFFNTGIALVFECGSEEVGKMWEHIGGNLRENKREFLKRRNENNWNFLFAASCNRIDPNVFPFVWRLYWREFNEEECKQLLFESFAEVNLDQSAERPRSVLYEWLSGALGDGILSCDEATKFLVSKNQSNSCYLLEITRWHPIQSIWALQNLFISGRLASAVVLKETRDLYMWLPQICFQYPTDAAITALVQEEFEDFHSRLKTFPPAAALQATVGGEYPFQGVKEEDRTKCQAFAVLMERQIGLEVEILGREEVVRRLGGEWCYWFKIQRHPILLLLCTTAVLSRFLSKGQVAELLLHVGENGKTVFHDRVYGDPAVFFSLYDVARWSMGEDALWRVHCLEGTPFLSKEKRPLLLSLLEAQEVREFATSPSVTKSLVQGTAGGHGAGRSLPPPPSRPGHRPPRGGARGRPRVGPAENAPENRGEGIPALPPTLRRSRHHTTSGATRARPCRRLPQIDGRCVDHPLIHLGRPCSRRHSPRGHGNP